jgi:hypothetical protein
MAWGIFLVMGGLARLRGRSPFGEAKARASILKRSFRGAREASEPGIQKQCEALDFGSAPKRAHPGMTLKDDGLPGQVTRQ